MSNELLVVATNQTEVLEPEIVTEDKVFVAGRSWSSMDIRRSFTVEGHTIKEILLDALRRDFDKSPTEFQETLWLSRCRCKVNGVEIESEKWDSYIPKAGEFVEFLVAPGKGGGGGKNVLNAVLMIAVMVVAVYVVGPWALQAAAGQFGATLTAAEGVTVYGGAAAQAVAAGTATASFGAQAVAGLAVMGTMTVGTYAVNKICPVTMSPQQATSSQGAQSSPTYSINGSQNAANPYGYVPLILGRFRYNGPLGAKSWTKQIGDDQYFNMLVVWGHADMTAKDFRIGETPLSDFKNVEHIFHGASTGNDLKYFSKSYDERSVGASLIYNEPVERVVGECDAISVDIFFPALADVSSGETKGTDVTFTIEYALEDSDKWTYYNASKTFFAPAQYIDSYTGVNREDAWCTVDGTWHVSQEEGGSTGRPDPYISPYDPHWRFDKDDPASGLDPNNPRPDPDNLQYDEDGNLYNNLTCIPLKRYRDKHKHHEYWFRDAWYVNEEMSKEIVIGASTTSPVTRSFEWAVPHGRYKVRITRISKDFESDSVQDDAKWSTSRAIVNKPAFNTPIPICCSELRIRASEQLSGYVSDFNALCTSRFPVYGNIDANGDEISNGVDANGKPVQKALGWIKDEDGDYIYAETRNPADHIRYLLTSRHALINPYTEAKIDEESLANFAEYCDHPIVDDPLVKFHFDLVCDSEAAAWNRMTAVASSGRGAITADNDGKFGVMVDNANKTVTQMFTPRNSWGFSIERSFYTLPHALRFSFYDETDNYKQKEGFVYADGYDKDNAIDIVEWSMTGKTNWDDNWRQGRYYLASLKLRPVTITLSTDWEWMMCRRGDVVGVAHDVLLNTFGTARVKALIYKRGLSSSYYYVYNEADMPSLDDALPVGVRLDDTVVFSEEGSYGIAIRSKMGKVLTYAVASEKDTETSDMMFVSSITKAQCPYIGALASVSIIGQETANYLVASISVGDSNSAELTLVPWAMPDILESDDKEIPDWEPPIYITSIGSSKKKLSAPTIIEVKSDESMLKRSGTALTVCLGAWWRLPDGITPEDGRIFIQGNLFITKEDDTEELIASDMVDTTTTKFIEFPNVVENKTYNIKLRVICDKSSRMSDWSDVVSHKVIGRTTKPKSPTKVAIKLNPPTGLNVVWDEVATLDLSYYHVVLTGDKLDTIEVRTQDLYTYVPIREWTGTLTANVYAVDVLGLKSETSATNSFEIKEPRTLFTEEPNIEVGTVYRNDTFMLEWNDCSTSWPIDYYEVYDDGNKSTSRVTGTQMIISARKVSKDYDFKITAVDIFGNRGGTALYTMVPPPMEDIKEVISTVEGTQIVLSWSEVANKPFGVEGYKVYELVGSEYVWLGTVKGTNFRITPPKISSEVPNVTRTFVYGVQAVDMAGNTSAIESVKITILPPAVPSIDTLNLGGGRINLSWSPGMSTGEGFTLPTIGYEVVRQWGEGDETTTESYGKIQDTTYLSVDPLPVGKYWFLVRAIDDSGNKSAWVSKEMSVKAPGKVTFFNCIAIDNNVMLYYTDPASIFFPIKEYIVSEAKGDDIPSEIGRTDTHFFADIKSAAGLYKYVVTPVDIAGNLGEPNNIVVEVNQPPDYVLYDDKPSLFNGQRENMALDGRGKMFGPVYSEETWNENVARFAGTIGAEEGDVIWDDKVKRSVGYYNAPFFNGEGKYIEVVDVTNSDKIMVPGCKINVLISSDTLTGDPKRTCKIEVSENGTDWRTSTEDGISVFERSPFRFVRYTITWTNGAVAISDITYKLDMKRKTDFGRVEVKSTDNGTGWESDPMLIGKWVPFNTDFIDVQSFPKPNVVNDNSDGGLTAFVSFVDEQNPKGFRVFVTDKNGQRVTAIVDWAAYGV